MFLSQIIEIRLNRQSGRCVTMSSVYFANQSTGISASSLVEKLNQIFSAFDRLTEKHGLEKIKTIGDAYMCVGGLPNADSDNAHRVVQTAIEISEFVEKGFQARAPGDPVEWPRASWRRACRAARRAAACPAHG